MLVVVFFTTAVLKRNFKQIAENKNFICSNVINLFPFKEVQFLPCFHSYLFWSQTRCFKAQVMLYMAAKCFTDKILILEMLKSTSIRVYGSCGFMSENKILSLREN